jgi:predicted PurR-regulated permease PerM
MPGTDSGPRRSATPILLTAAAFVIVVAGLRAAEALVVPFLLSVFIAVIAAPPVFWLERRGLPKWLAMLSVLAALAGVGIALSAIVGSSIRKFSRELPTYKARLIEETQGLVEWLRNQGVPVSQDEFLQYFDPGSAIQLVADVFNGFGGVLANAFLIFLTVVFILFEAHSFPSKIRAVVSNAERSLARFDGFNENLMRYLAIKSMASLGTGATITIWLAILGVDHPLLWGLLAFLLNFVPNIGSVIAAVPAVLFSFIQLGPATAAWAAAAYVVVNVVVGNVIEPRFLGRGLGLSTLVVFISLVFWGWVLGPVGMFLSVPLTMTAKIALDSHDETRWLAVMLGPENAIDPAPPSEMLAETEHTDSDEHDGNMSSTMDNKDSKPKDIG